MKGPKKRWFTAGDGGDAGADGPGSRGARGLFQKAGLGEAGGEDSSVAAGPGDGAEGDEAAGGAHTGAATRTLLSRKELARELRRQAYQKAKRARAADPKHLAMKEAAKLRRREQYQQVKVRRKEREAELKEKEKAAVAADQAEAKRQLAERVKSAVGRGSEPGRALARDIERALQCADVRELMDRLRGESAELAARHASVVGAPAGLAPEQDDE